MREEAPIALPNLKPVRWKQIGLGLLLLVATIMAYRPALEGGLIIDDAEHLTTPSLRSLAGLWRIWSVVGATHQYFPILHSAFWLEYRLWGDALLGYHLTNVLLHAASACLLVAIMRRLALPGLCRWQHSRWPRRLRCWISRLPGASVRIRRMPAGPPGTLRKPWPMVLRCPRSLAGRC